VDRYALDANAIRQDFQLVKGILEESPPEPVARVPEPVPTEQLGLF
jgi:hypothetical protein